MQTTFIWLCALCISLSAMAAVSCTSILRQPIRSASLHRPHIGFDTTLHIVLCLFNLLHHPCFTHYSSCNLGHMDSPETPPLRHMLFCTSPYLLPTNSACILLPELMHARLSQKLIILIIPKSTLIRQALHDLWYMKLDYESLSCPSIRCVLVFSRPLLVAIQLPSLTLPFPLSDPLRKIVLNILKLLLVSYWYYNTKIELKVLLLRPRQC